MRKFVLTAILSIVASFASNAQKTVFTERAVGTFTGVCVSDDFVVNLKTSDNCVFKTNVDERLDSYVSAYVNDGVLYLALDRKQLPADLKKALRSSQVKNPVVEAEVSIPEFKSLEINGNALIKGAGSIETDSFVLTVAEKAVVENLKIVCRCADVKISRNADVNVGINASSRLSLQTSGTSKTSLEFAGDSLFISSSGSSSVGAVVDASRIAVSNSGMSNVRILSGKVGGLDVIASGSSKLDAGEVVVPSAYMVQSGSSKSLVNVSDTLKVNLVGSSVLEFRNDPYINLERIVSSTLIRSSETSSK